MTEIKATPRMNLKAMNPEGSGAACVAVLEAVSVV